MSECVRGSAVVLVFAAVLSGCGADRVRSVASDRAKENVRENLVEVMACLEALAPALEPSRGLDETGRQLDRCADTSFVGRADDEILSGEAELSGHVPTLLVTLDLGADSIDIILATSGAGRAEAGVSNAHAFAITCWRAAIDVRSDRLGQVASADCRASVVRRLHNSTVIPFDQFVG